MEERNTNTVRPPSSCTCGTPATRVIPVWLPVIFLVAKFPSVAITRGSIRSIWRSRYGQQASISSGCGSRLPGGRDLRMLAMNTSSRFIPISSSSLFSSCPARPTNGRPCRSSSAPGASPTKISSASALPEPKTTLVRSACNGQRVQPATSR